MAASAPPAEKLDALLEAHPDDAQAAMQRIAVAITRDEYQIAFDGLMAQLRTAPQGEREFLHKVMLMLFSILGEENSLTKRFRKLYLDRL